MYNLKRPQVERQLLNPILSERNKKETEMRNSTTKLVVTSLLVLVGLTLAVTPAMAAAPGVQFSVTSLTQTVRANGDRKSVV